jgi:hypothetical protein
MGEEAHVIGLSMPLEKQKIIDEIERTGFPLELRVSKLLQDRAYVVEHNIYYIDKDENKGREIEIVASTLSQTSHSVVGRGPESVQLHLVVECKRSAHPWVVFTSPLTPSDQELRTFKYKGLHSIENIPPQFMNPIFERHPTWSGLRRGRNYVQVRFGDKGEVNAEITKAITTVVKAAVEMHADKAPGQTVQLFQPVVVLDGQLFEAYLNPQHTISLEQQSWLPVSFAYQSPSYTRQRLTVVIVQETHFWGFLDRMNSFLEAWAECLAENSEFVMVPPPRA